MVMLFGVKIVHCLFCKSLCVDVALYDLTPMPYFEYTVDYTVLYNTAICIRNFHMHEVF